VVVEITKKIVMENLGRLSAAISHVTHEL